jgi:hypothetical protein
MGLIFQLAVWQSLDDPVICVSCPVGPLFRHAQPREHTSQLLRGPGLRRKRGANDRHGRSSWAGQIVYLGIELMRERLGDARPKPRFYWQRQRPACQFRDPKVPISVWV